MGHKTFLRSFWPLGCFSYRIDEVTYVHAAQNTINWFVGMKMTKGTDWVLEKTTARGNIKYNIITIARYISKSALNKLYCKSMFWTACRQFANNCNVLIWRYIHYTKHRTKKGYTKSQKLIGTKTMFYQINWFSYSTNLIQYVF